MFSNDNRIMNNTNKNISTQTPPRLRLNNSFFVLFINTIIVLKHKITRALFLK